MTVRELIIELLKHPLDVEVELAEEGSAHLEPKAIHLETYPTGKILWLG